MEGGSNIQQTAADVMGAFSNELEYCKYLGAIQWPYCSQGKLEVLLQNTGKDDPPSLSGSIISRYYYIIKTVSFINFERGFEIWGEREKVFIRTFYIYWLLKILKDSDF